MRAIEHEKIDLSHLEGQGAKLPLPRVGGGKIVDKSRASIE